MLHDKIQATIGLIDDVVDNRQKENENKNTANVSRETVSQNLVSRDGKNHKL